MELNSCIYECRVGHNRISPKKHNFSYGLYTFYIDLDELEILEKKNKFFSLESFNLFSFYNKDHFLKYGNNLKNSIIQFAETNGLNQKVEKIRLLTHVRILGYTFNPVCFYFLFNQSENPIACIIEVHNTFGEMKPFFLTSNQNGEFYLRTKKYFYVSPFFNLDTEFEFKVTLPSNELKIHIDDFEDNQKVFYSFYKGKKLEFKDWNLFKLFFKYPLLTIRIISLIHWQAFLLYLKKIPFIKKLENPELQKGVYNGKNS